MKNRKSAKRSKMIYIIGSVTLGIVALLTVYLVLIATGVISATSQKIVIATSSVSVEYNGSEIKDETWWLESGTLKDGHSLKVTVTGSRTDVGQTKNYAKATVVDANGSDVTDEYEISYDLGTIDVFGRVIVFQSASAEKEYDGDPLTANGEDDYQITSGTLVEGHSERCYINGSITAAGKAPNNFIAVITDENGKDVTANYDIKYLYGTLYVHGDLLHISTGSATKVYDGTPLVNDEYSVISGAVAPGDSLHITVTGSRTEVGVSDNTASIVILAPDGTDVTARYETLFDWGKLTVSPLTFRIQTKGDYKTYDGTPLVCKMWRPVHADILVDERWYDSGESVTVGGYTISAVVTGSITDAGHVENSALVSIALADGTAAGDFVEVECEAGMLYVDERPLTVQSANAEKVYDGTPLTCDRWDIVSLTPLADGHRAEVAVTGTILSPGRADNTIAEVLITNAAGKNVTRNYAIKLQEGVLTIMNEDGSVPSLNESNNDSADIGDDGKTKEEEEGEDNDEPAIAMYLCSPKDGKVYLKYTSKGSYNYTTDWRSAEPYSTTIEGHDDYGNVTGRYSMDYLAGQALFSTGSEYEKLQVQLVNTTQCFLPYYMSMADADYSVQTSDVRYTSTKREYTVYHHFYDFISDGGKRLQRADLAGLSAAEAAYSSYVAHNYLDLPDTTRQYMQSVIDAQGFGSLSFADKISAVARYVRSAARYDLDYDKELDNEPDVAIAFLETYKTGVCRHYATAATLIYRTLGIPARYTVGYTGDVMADEWVEVTTKQAHAWVEIYVEGAGWIMVEVTGGGGGYDNSGDSSVSQIGDPNSPNKLVIRPFDVSASRSELGGEPLTYKLPSLHGLAELEALGYTSLFTVAGSISTPGKAPSEITKLQIFDPDHNDVTNNYNITLQKGVLQVYISELTVRTETLSGVYNGTDLCSQADGDWVCIGTLVGDDAISDFTFTGAQRHVGSSLNTFELTILNKDGKDVTDTYKINMECGNLTVSSRAVIITCGSALGYYMTLAGQPLTCGDYTILGVGGEQGLGEGDTATVSIRGSQTGVGRCENVVESVEIVDGEGNDVTMNYSIEYNSGWIIVLPGFDPGEEP